MESTPTSGAVLCHCGGDIYLRTDAESAAALAAAGSTPFVYQRRDKAITTNLWRLVASAYDDPDELKRWSGITPSPQRARIDEANQAVKGDVHQLEHCKDREASKTSTQKPRNCRAGESQ